jgi:DNA-binding NarL/FixJ family response regulator
MLTKEKKIRVGIVASSRLVRDYLGSIIESNMEIAFSISEAALLETYHSPEIVLVDARDLDHATVTALGKRSATVKLIAIDADDDGLDLIECARLGVRGFTLKDSGAEKIAETIQIVNDNRKAIPSTIANRLYEQLAMVSDRAARLDNTHLTVREHQILGLVAQGLTNKEIAQRLNIATHTAKTHVHNILRKVGCRRRVDLLSPYRYSVAADGSPSIK